MATFEFTPDYAPVKAAKPEIQKIKFGDGYEQRYPKGINNNPKSWSLAFNQRSQEDADEIEAFLDARGGWEAFDWTPPDSETEIRVKCESWSKTMEKGNYYSISCTFEQVFEP